MKKKLLAVLAATPMLFVGWAVAFADEHEEENKAPWVTPVDTFTCSFNDGKDMDDLNKVIAAWNEALDGKGVEDYGAMILTPNYHGPDTFQFGWLGFWTSQEAMGAGMDMYKAEMAGRFDAEFAKVSTCSTHEHWATINVKESGGDGPDNFVLMFSNCTRDKEVSWDDLFARIGKATAHMEENGSKSGEYMMWQVFGGEGIPDWDFKWVSSYANYTDFGKDYQYNANGGGRQKMNEIMDDALECDAARVYDARMIRRVPDPAEE